MITSSRCGEFLPISLAHYWLTPVIIMIKSYYYFHDKYFDSQIQSVDGCLFVSGWGFDVIVRLMLHREPNVLLSIHNRDRWIIYCHGCYCQSYIWKFALPVCCKSHGAISLGLYYFLFYLHCPGLILDYRLFMWARYMKIFKIALRVKSSGKNNIVRFRELPI